MNTIDKINNITDILGNIINFIGTNEELQKDFNEYLSTIGLKNASSSQITAEAIHYIFERIFAEKSIMEIFIENNKNLDSESKNIANSLNNAWSSIFEIKKVLRNGFELYNLVNEKSYTVVSLSKMNSFRGIGAEQFIIARIFEYENQDYLIQISNILGSNQKEEAMHYTIAKIVQNPELVYKDNQIKKEQIEKQIANLYEKFIDCFGKDEIITTNKFADNLMGLFNDFSENNQKPNEEEIKANIQELENYKYFEIKDLNNSYENFLENSMGGFSSHSQTYDVGIIYDKELGLFAIPFYKTFCKIFASKDFKTIENYDKCIEYFMTTSSISANILKRVYEKYSNFMDVINSIYSTKMTFDELIRKYKSKELKEKIFSSTSVLYNSKVFDNTLNLFEEESQKPEIDTTKVGRNDPCPCGSGKKFKKCCGANL